MADRQGELIVGIDLGTSNTVVAYLDELDRLQLVPDATGITVHPSVVSFHPNGGVVVGVAGKQRKVIDPRNTIYSAKRMIGQPYSSPAVQETARRVPFEIKPGANEQAVVTTRAGDFAIPEVSAIVLDHAKKLATAALGAEIGRAVVTVPASFTDVQRASTATAGALAGLTVVRVLNEPTAAAIAYGHTRRLDEVIAVYDFGGGTFDITILKLEDQVYTVLGTSGDAFLGGEDIDERLVDRMVAGFLAKHRIDLRQSEAAMTRLRAVAEHTKIELSRRSRALVKIEEIAHGKQGAPLALEATLTRDELIGAIGDLADRTFASCKEAMVLAGIAPTAIKDVVLVGGTTRIPFIRERVAQFFGREPRADMNPEHAIATGAALQAASIEKMLARPPRRVSSVPIPLDDLEEAPARIAEVKRPKRGSGLFAGQPVPAVRADAFFGDLFGDKPAPAPTRPSALPQGKVATRPIARIVPPARQAPTTPPLPPIVETRREQRTMALPVITRPPAAPSIPMIELDDFAENERSGELELPRKEESQIAIEIDPPTVPPGVSSINIEIDPPTVPPGVSSIDIEIDPPTGRGGVAVDMDFDAPRQPPPLRGPAPLDLGLPSLELDIDVDDAPLGAASIELVDPDAGRPALIGPPITPVSAAPAPRLPVVVDVTPRGLGIGTVAGFCEELILRNTQLPVATRKQFATARDLQDVVRIVVCQGESRRLENNILVGDLVLENLPKRRRGETRIDVEFRLDVSGILHVTARDVATGTEQRARLDLRGGMAPEAMAAAADRIAQLSRKS